MRNRIKIPILFLFLFLCLPLVPLGDFVKPFVSPEVAKQLSSTEIRAVEAQTKKPPSTIGTVGNNPETNYLVHSTTFLNITLYASTVAVNVVSDGTKRYDRILNNTVATPWNSPPISYWAKWKVEWWKVNPGTWESLTEQNVGYYLPFKDSTGVTLVVNQTMNDNSVFTITYKLRASDGKLKWDLKFKASCAWTTRYRFTYEYFATPSASKMVTVEKTTVTAERKILFKYSPSYTLSFFYDDVDQGKYPIMPEVWDAANRKHYFSIDLGFFSTWQTKEIDPGTVGSSWDQYAVGYPFQRRAFRYLSRDWQWWCDDANLGFTSNYGGHNDVRACDDGYEFSIFFNGTHVAYAYSSGVANEPLYFRMGAPQSDGSMSWTAAEQTAVAAVAGVSYLYPTVCMDSVGYPWIAYCRYDGTDYYATTSRCTKVDGTWTAGAGFPQDLSAADASVWGVSPIPLTSQKIMVIYANLGLTLRARYWDGAAFAAEEAASTTTIESWKYFSAVANSNDAHLVFLEATNHDIIHVMRTYSNTTWSKSYEKKIYAGVTATSAPALSIYTTNSTLFCFWVGAPTDDHGFYKEWAAGIYLGSSGAANVHDWWDESVNGMPNHDGISSYYSNNAASKLGMVWVNQFGPYAVRWTDMELNDAPTNGAGTITDMDDADNLYAQKKLYTGSSVHTDLQGFADFDYVEFRILQAAAVRARFRYDEDTGAFTVEEGGANWALDGTSSASKVGNTITVTWKFAAKWSATEEADLEIELYCIDASAASDTDTAQTNYFDVVTRLVTSGFASNKAVTDLGGAIVVSGTVYYGNDPASNVASASYPPDAEFTGVSIHSAAHVVQGTDNTIVNGAFSVAFNIPALIQNNVYHCYINMADAEYTDADAVDGDTCSCWGSRLEHYQFGTTDADRLVGRNTAARIWVKTRYEHDLAAFTNAGGSTLSINGTAATWDAVNGYWRADITVNAVSNRTFVVSTFVEATYGLTANRTTAPALWVQWTDISVGSIAVSGTSGTYQTQLNITVTWAHNASAVNNGKFYVYNATNQITNVNSSATGLVQFTLVGTLHGASTLIVNGSRWLAGEYINIYSATNLAYSVTASGLAATVPSSATLAETISVPYQFTNAAVLSGTSLKAENVRVRFRILQGATVILESNTTLFDVNAAATYSSTKTLIITGVSVTGSYTFRVTVFHIGSDWQLATQDYSIYLQVGGSPPGVGVTVGDGKKLFLLSVGDLSNSAMAGQQLTGLIRVTFTGISSLQIARAETNVTWLTFPSLPNGTLVSPIDLSWLANIPYDLPAGQYVIRVTVTGKDNALEGTSFGYITLDVTSTAPVQEWTSNLGLIIVIIAILVIIISSSGKGRQKRAPRLTHARARRKRGR